MKFFLIVLLLAVSYAECRKAHIPINKNANIDFINMEGGGVRPAQNNNRPLPSQATTLKPVVPPSAPVPSQKPVAPQPGPSPIPAIQPAPKPSPSNVLPSSPSSKPTPNLITPKPVNPAPVSNPITTPGPGSVKSLVHFYDSQGKASPIRPYSYSQAVKQGFLKNLETLCHHQILLLPTDRTETMRRIRLLLLFTTLLLQDAICEPPVDSASLPLEHRGGAYGPPLPPAHTDDPWPLATPDSPKIKHLQVQCEKTHMRVNIEFDRPFYGMIFSKGFYSDPHCMHLKPGTGHLSATFEIFLNSCGMASSANHNVAAYGSPTPSGSYVENTIIVQYDPYVQEVWDQARKLRCTWYDYYEKAVTFRPFQVDMLHAVTANFLGDNLQCWMQIQVGKGPWASEVSGIVKIGQTMTMVLAIKDDENKFDMLVRNCVAHDGKRAPIQLVDQYGCVVRPKIMSKFQKIKNFGPSASVVSFAYFQAFKFPDSMNVHFQCVIQVCRYNCPEPKCGGLGADYGVPLLGGNALTAGGEYGLPNGGHGEYGPPPPAPHAEYGVPPAFPDPRHPADAVGAYSEKRDDVVPPPQAQVSSTPNAPSPSSPAPVRDEDDVNLPPPPPPGRRGIYNTVKRKDEGHGNLATLGGRPRSVEDLPESLMGIRRRRETSPQRIYKRDAQEMTDVNTSRTIQVVAPGDVNFALNNAASNETVVIQSPATDPETICMSVPSFVAGLVMLLLVLVVASLVAAFLFVRVRALDRKGAHGATAYFETDYVKHTN